MSRPAFIRQERLDIDDTLAEIPNTMDDVFQELNRLLGRQNEMLELLAANSARQGNLPGYTEGGTWASTWETT